MLAGALFHVSDGEKTSQIVTNSGVKRLKHAQQDWKTQYCRTRRKLTCICRMKTIHKCINRPRIFTTSP